MSRPIPFTRDLYVLSDSVSALLKAVEDGATIVQLRDKSENHETIRAKAREIIAYKQKKPFLFILNDDAVLAAQIGADGVHVGQDASTREARRCVGEARIVGKSTHNLEQARQALQDGADYISVGPVYATPTKAGRTPVGLAYVREAAASSRLPFVAIGGIDLSNIDEVLTAGAKTVAVVRACGQAGELLRRIKGGP